MVCEGDFGRGEGKREENLGGSSFGAEAVRGSARTPFYLKTSSVDSLGSFAGRSKVGANWSSKYCLASNNDLVPGTHHLTLLSRVSRTVQTRYYLDSQTAACGSTRFRRFALSAHFGCWPERCHVIQLTTFCVATTTHAYIKPMAIALSVCLTIFR